ncbi:ice-structuring glycoprotein-like [Bacillus rossius redtenbacheri]|uniref:ice-structuring glycoprotein-like n=1 Tax=Bacillus rossius redtenbacheri TaxID=93214 RepID=UPI002FDE1380
MSFHSVVPDLCRDQGHRLAIQPARPASAQQCSLTSALPQVPDLCRDQTHRLGHPAREASECSAVQPDLSLTAGTRDTALAIQPARPASAQQCSLTSALPQVPDLCRDQGHRLGHPAREASECSAVQPDLSLTAGTRHTALAIQPARPASVQQCSLTSALPQVPDLCRDQTHRLGHPAREASECSAVQPDLSLTAGTRHTALAIQPARPASAQQCSLTSALPQVPDLCRDQTHRLGHPAREASECSAVQPDLSLTAGTRHTALAIQPARPASAQQCSLTSALPQVADLCRDQTHRLGHPAREASECSAVQPDLSLTAGTRDTALAIQPARPASAQQCSLTSALPQVPDLCRDQTHRLGHPAREASECSAVQPDLSLTAGTRHTALAIQPARPASAQQCSLTSALPQVPDLCRDQGHRLAIQPARPASAQQCSLTSALPQPYHRYPTSAGTRHTALAIQPARPASAQQCSLTSALPQVPDLCRDQTHRLAIQPARPASAQQCSLTSALPQVPDLCRDQTHRLGHPAREASECSAVQPDLSLTAGARPLQGPDTPPWPSSPRGQRVLSSAAWPQPYRRYPTSAGTRHTALAIQPARPASAQQCSLTSALPQVPDLCRDQGHRLGHPAREASECSAVQPDLSLTAGTRHTALAIQPARPASAQQCSLTSALPQVADLCRDQTHRLGHPAREASECSAVQPDLSLTAGTRHTALAIQPASAQQCSLTSALPQVPDLCRDQTHRLGHPAREASECSAVQPDLSLTAGTRDTALAIQPARPASAQQCSLTSALPQVADLCRDQGHRLGHPAREASECSAVQPDLSLTAGTRHTALAIQPARPASAQQCSLTSALPQVADLCRDQTHRLGHPAREASECLAVQPDLSLTAGSRPLQGPDTPPGHPASEASKCKCATTPPLGQPATAAAEAKHTPAATGTTMPPLGQPATVAA